MTSRDKINARRKTIAFRQVALLVFVVLSSWWLINHYERFPFLIYLIGFGFIFRVFEKRDRCPSCDQCISMLPSEGHLQIPELAHSINQCPYCGDDFSLAENELKFADSTETLTQAPLKQ
ncbi:MAG: hypothetical protein QM496_05675 [Verrucomicrobiota bacterium]